MKKLLMCPINEKFQNFENLEFFSHDYKIVCFDIAPSDENFGIFATSERKIFVFYYKILKCEYGYEEEEEEEIFDRNENEEKSTDQYKPENKVCLFFVHVCLSENVFVRLKFIQFKKFNV